MAAGTAAGGPNSSSAMTAHASGVFAAAPNTATNPTAAKRGTGAWSAVPSVAPSDAPMTNSGVTSPPRKPEPSDTAVKPSFQAKAMGATPAPPASAAFATPVDSPREARGPAAATSTGQ